MHGKCRFVPFLFVEGSSVATCAVVAFLNSASEVRFFLLAEFANPQVYHMFCFTVQVTGNSEDLVVYYDFPFVVDERTLATSAGVAFLGVGYGA